MMHSFGIVGTGMIAGFHAEAIRNMKNCRLGGVYSRNQENTNNFAEAHGGKAYRSMEEMMDDLSIDIVTIATPSGAHLEPALKAADAGKHVICEKPLEVTSERAARMINHCADRGVVLSGIFNRRFNPAVATLKKAVDAGRFGTLSLCDAQIKWYRDQAYYDSAKWRGTWELDGGGALMNQSIHTIDLLLYFVGPVGRVSASVATLGHSGIEVEDTAVAILEFENGARGAIQASTACWSESGHPAEIQICGTDGSVFLQDDQFRKWEFARREADDASILETMGAEKKQGKGANDPRAIDYTEHQRNFEDVVRAIDTGTSPSVSGEEALKAIRLIEAIYESASDQGRWTSLT
jgi:UDP-N-acetyl-2-amino-2-deoxyglucuronate dehydrogenase